MKLGMELGLGLDLGIGLEDIGLVTSLKLGTVRVFSKMFYKNVIFQAPPLPHGTTNISYHKFTP